MTTEPQFARSEFAENSAPYLDRIERARAVCGPDRVQGERSETCVFRQVCQQMRSAAWISKYVNFTTQVV